jgi:hypothetical protein
MKSVNLKSLVAIFAVFFTMASSAEPLQASSPEYKQLEALGYEIDPVDKGDIATIARGASSKLVISKEEGGIAVARYFTRTKKNLTDAQKLKLFTLINQVNVDLRYQVSLTDTYLTVAVYQAGPHTPRGFGSAVNQVEMSKIIFDKYPELLTLLQ